MEPVIPIDPSTLDNEGAADLDSPDAPLNAKKNAMRAAALQKARMVKAQKKQIEAMGGEPEPEWQDITNGKGVILRRVKSRHTPFQKSEEILFPHDYDWGTIIERTRAAVDRILNPETLGGRLPVTRGSATKDEYVFYNLPDFNPETSKVRITIEVE